MTNRTSVRILSILIAGAAVMMVTSSGHGAALTGAATATMTAPTAPQPDGRLTEDGLRRLYLEVVEHAVDVFEPLWTDASATLPNSGFFDVRKYDDWWPGYKGYAGIVTVPANGMIDYCYALLLNETDKQVFGLKRVPRKVILEHAVQSVRWCSLTSVYASEKRPYIHEDTAPQFLEGKYWRREYGYRADEAGFLTMAGAWLWPNLDAETKKAFEETMIGGANRERIVYSWKPPQGGNQDQAKQDLSSTMGAALLFPHRPDRAQYLDALRGFGIDMVSTVHDFAKPAVADGKPVSEWAKGWNLYQDYTGDHHGWAHVWYGCDKLFEGYLYVYLLSKTTGQPMPEIFTYPGNGYDGVLDRIKTLAQPESDPASVHGMEYDSFYGSGHLAFCYGAVIKKDPVAAALEERSARLLNKHARAVPIYDYHNNKWSKAAVSYMVHKLGGGRAEPVTFEAAWRSLGGVAHHPWQQNLLHRSADKLALFSWGTVSSENNHFGGTGNGVCGFVIPARLGKMAPEPEPLVYLHPFSVVGQVSVTDAAGESEASLVSSDDYRYSWSDDGFSTSGSAPAGGVDLKAAFFSFEQGPAFYFSEFVARKEARLTWAGIPVYFYSRPGMTPSRSFRDAAGSARLETPRRNRTSWWSVEGLLGLVSAGGERDLEVRRTVGNNWARTDAYKDKCDTVFLGGLKDISLRAGERAGREAVVFYAETPDDVVARAAGEVLNLASRLPDGWAGAAAPAGASSGTRAWFVALANLAGGAGRASVALSCPEGAPVLPTPTLVTGRDAKFEVDLDGRGTFGAAVDMFLAVEGATPVIARKLPAGRTVLEPAAPGAGPVTIRIAARAGEILEVLEAGAVPRRITLDAAACEKGIRVDVSGPVTIVRTSVAAEDATGPAVEIKPIAVREDGRVRVEVEAADRCGISAVRLTMDGRPVGELRRDPLCLVASPRRGLAYVHGRGRRRLAAEERARRLRPDHRGSGGLRGEGLTDRRLIRRPSSGHRRRRGRSRLRRAEPSSPARAS